MCVQGTSNLIKLELATCVSAKREEAGGAGSSCKKLVDQSVGSDLSPERARERFNWDRSEGWADSLLGWIVE